MSFLLLGDFRQTLILYIIGPIMVLLGLFLMLLVLIQRGKGGGLSGAFGGMGGQSAFGARAGDTIMWVTVGVAAAWILICTLGVAVMNRGEWNTAPAPGADSPTGAATSREEPAEPASGETGQPPADQ